MNKESKKEITISQEIEPYQYEAYAQAIMKQLKNPNIKDVNLKKAARAAGIPATVDPQELAEGDAFTFLMDAKGLTKDFIASALYEDIKLKPQNRLGELKLASQMHGVIEKKSKDASSVQAESVNKAMDLLDKLIDNKVTYEQDPVTGEYKAA